MHAFCYNVDLNLLFYVEVFELVESIALISYLSDPFHENIQKVYELEMPDI